MTQPLRDGGQPQIADYVNKAADGIERWASNMRQQDLEDAVRAVEQFARRQPAMFLGIAFGAGLAAARFLKSSNDARDRRAYGEFDYESSNRTPSYGASGTRSGSLGTGTTSVGSTGLGGTDFGGTAGAGGRGTTSGDIPRVSDRTTGEVL
jgi:hypothetical protein